MQRTTTAAAKRRPHDSAAKRGAGRGGVGASKELRKWASLVWRRHSRHAHANTDAASVPRLARLRACASSRPAAQPLAGRGGSGTTRYNGAERRQLVCVSKLSRRSCAGSRLQPLGQFAPVSEQRTMNLAMVPIVRIALAFVRSRHSQTVNTLHSSLRNATHFRRSRRRFSWILGSQYSWRTLGSRPARQVCPCQKQP